jgi:hypothetical protein
MYKLEVFTAVCLQYASCAGCPGWHGIRLLPSLWHFAGVTTKDVLRVRDTQETWQPYLLEP